MITPLRQTPGSSLCRGDLNTCRRPAPLGDGAQPAEELAEDRVRRRGGVDGEPTRLEQRRVEASLQERGALGPERLAILGVIELDQGLEQRQLDGNVDEAARGAQTETPDTPRRL